MTGSRLDWLEQAWWGKRSHRMTLRILARAYEQTSGICQDEEERKMQAAGGKPRVYYAYVCTCEHCIKTQMCTGICGCPEQPCLTIVCMGAFGFILNTGSSSLLPSPSPRCCPCQMGHPQGSAGMGEADIWARSTAYEALGIPA